MSDNVYKIITDRILDQLNKGEIPWRNPWNGISGFPKNLVSKKEYRGVNVFLLSAQAFGSPYFVTFKQAKDKGGSVKKGEKGTPVIFWKAVKKQNPSPEDVLKGRDKYFMLRYYTVFNVTQCEKLDYPKPEIKEFNPILECEKMIQGYMDCPEITYGGDRAFYSPTFDKITMPDKGVFHSSEEFYSTIFHEMVHSTGHEKRLNREGITNPIKFGSHDYSFEELIAECGAAFLCGHTGIHNKTIENSAAYIQSWVKKLQNEPKWIVEAAAKATKAVDLIRWVKEEIPETEEE